MKQTVSILHVDVPLTERECEVLDRLARDQELPRERVMIQALRAYQLLLAGHLVRNPALPVGGCASDD